jgi:outer membrane protein OmpA-like peptidoglycan-associated protein
LACALPIAAMADESAPATEPVPRIPFVAELTITGVVSESNGDYEPIYQVQSIGNDSYRMLFSAEVPVGFGSETAYVEVPRTVSLEDQRNARTMRPRFFTGDPETFRDTTPFFSASVLNDLRRNGEAAFTWCSVETFFGIPVAKFYSGTLKRIESAKVPVLVNGKRVELAAMHVGGKLTTGNDVLDADVYILDDPDNPLFLRSRNSRVIRIDFPVTDAPSESLENALAERRSADVYGIYFAFNSASIRPQSERKLKEIAAILKSNPDWALRIDGHTDSIGSDASNLELSRRRAEAVVNALVQRHGIAADRLVHGGYGEGNPKETNDTVEGRARNRRVELTRL